MQFGLAVAAMMPKAKSHGTRFQFITNILELIVYDSQTHASSAKIDKVSFKVFQLVGSVAKRLNEVEEAVGAHIDSLSKGTLQHDLSRARRLFFMHTEGTDFGTIDLDALSVELKAAEFSHNAEISIIAKLREEGLSELSLLDFLVYCPLFLGAHDTILRNPLDAHFE